MKKFIFVVLSVLCMTCFAKDFGIEVDMSKPTAIVKHKAEDWIFLKHESDYSFHVNVDGFKSVHSDLLLVHSLVSFDAPRKLENADIFVDKIYSYGLIDCNKGLFSLLGELYVDDKGEVKLNSMYGEGDHVVALNAPGTARYEAYVYVCKTKGI